MAVAAEDSAVDFVDRVAPLSPPHAAKPAGKDEKDVVPKFCVIGGTCAVGLVCALTMVEMPISKGKISAFDVRCTLCSCFICKCFMTGLVVRFDMGLVGDNGNVN